MMKSIAENTSENTSEKSLGKPSERASESTHAVLLGLSENVTESAAGSFKKQEDPGKKASIPVGETSTTQASIDTLPQSVRGPGSPSVLAAPERIHPALWRASQIACSPGLYAETGYPEISAQLPGGGWPLGNLIEVMTPRAGIGELELFKPALCNCTSRQSRSSARQVASEKVSHDQRPIVLLQPPYAPQACAWAHWGVTPSRLLWLSPQGAADALWAAEHILDSGSFAALVLWQHAMRDAALRRLQLAAQKGDTLFVLVRALSAARHSSPAPLRLALHPAPAGLHVHIVKRRGSVSEQPVQVVLYPDAYSGNAPSAVDSSADPAAFTESRHANMDSRAFTTTHTGHTLP